MLKALISTALTLFLLAYILPNVSYLDWTTLVLASIVMTLLTTFAKPILNILFLPVNVVTLGLFSVVLNVLLLWLVTYLVPGFNIQPMIILGVHLNEFFSLLVVSFLISFVQGILRALL
jgi:putative membrane protein